MEKLEMRKSRSHIKILGTLVSISGALMVTLYKGFPILVPSSALTIVVGSDFASNWIIGALFFFVGDFSTSLLNINLVKMLSSDIKLTWEDYYCYLPN